jgi:hypothetical protein
MKHLAPHRRPEVTRLLRIVAHAQRIGSNVRPHAGHVELREALARDHIPSRAHRIELREPILDVLLLFGAAMADDVEQGKTLLSRVVAMLSKMCR